MRRVLVLALLTLATVGRTQEFVMAPEGPYRENVPRPTAMGLKPSTVWEQQRYLEALATSAPDRIQLREFGKSTQGRPLRIAIIAPAGKVESLQASYQALAKGEAQPGLPPLVWINQSIHGDEAASFESSMWLLYNLVASESPRMKMVRQKATVIVNPCYNPDGHDRYATWYNSLPVGSANPASPEHREPRNVNGRTNAFFFDLNRDRIAMSQVETRAEVAEFQRWWPQVYVDQHGEVETYFFPPTALATNVYVDRKRYEKWTQIFGRATAGAFDQNGYSYYIKGVFDFYSPGYLDTFATLQGAIGMTHETDAAAVRLRNSDGSERTLLRAMSKHLTSALAVIEASANQGEDLKKDFVAFRQASLDAGKLGDKRFIVMESADSGKAGRLSDHLTAMGVESTLIEGRSNFEGVSLWTGDKAKAQKSGTFVIVDLAQANGALARAMLEPKSDFEPEFKENPGFYDVTGWALPYLYGMDAWFTGASPRLDPLPRPMILTGKSTVGYAIRPSLDGSRKLIELGKRGYKVQINPEPMTLAGREYPANTAMVLAQANSDRFKDLNPDELGLEPLPTMFPDKGDSGPGSERVLSLKAPKIALATGGATAPTGYGFAWFWLTKMGLDFTPLGSLANLDEFTVLMVPEGESFNAGPVREWVNGGGCLIVLGGSFGSGTAWERGSTKSGRSVPGAIGMGAVNGDSWLTLGITDPLAVPLDGGSFSTDGEAAVHATGKILSGWTWDDTANAVKDAAIARVFEVGRGHVVVFAQDPTERYMWPGLEPFLWNAIAYGPRH